MTINNWLRESTQLLNSAGLQTARLDCLVLLEDCLHKDRAHLLAHPETELTHEQEKLLQRQLKRRQKHEPLAYIRGKSEFYGRSFAVNEHVLQPRPETETMIDLLKTLPRKDIQTVVDVGTGSGCLAITAAIELGVVQVIATDIDPACLEVARQNCLEHKTTVDLKQADLVKGLKLSEKTVILANLPYVPDNYKINEAAKAEPKLALFGGPDGLDLYRQLFTQINDQSNQPAYVMTESLPFQHTALAEIAQDYGYKLSSSQDLIQLFSC